MKRENNRHKTLSVFKRIKRYLILKFIALLTKFRFSGSYRLEQLASSLLMPFPEKPIVCSTVLGFELLIDPLNDRGVERAIYFRGGYEFGTLEVMKEVLRKGDIFVDAGSNIGLMSLAASKFVFANGSVHSFEAHPETFSILEDNIAINGAGNIHAYNFALGSVQGNAFIYNKLQVNRGSATLIKPADGEDKKHQVKMIRLDDFISER